MISAQPKYTTNRKVWVKYYQKEIIGKIIKIVATWSAHNPVIVYYININGVITGIKEKNIISYV